MLKSFNAKTGVTMDASFAEHVKMCSRCANARSSRRGLGNLCLEGSVLLKRDTKPPRSKKLVLPPEPDFFKAQGKVKQHYVE